MNPQKCICRNDKASKNITKSVKVNNEKNEGLATLLKGVNHKFFEVNFKNQLFWYYALAYSPLTTKRHRETVTLHLLIYCEQLGYRLYG